MGIRETGGPPSREYRPPPQIEPDVFPDLTRPEPDVGAELRALRKRDVFPDLTRPEPDVGAERVEPASERPKLAIDMVDLEAPTADGGQAEGPAEATYLLGPIVEGAEQSDEVGQGDELNEELVPRAGIERAEPGQGDEVNDERDRGGRVRTLGIVGAVVREPATVRVERVEVAADGTEQMHEIAESVVSSDAVKPAEPMAEAIEPTAERSIANTDLLKPLPRGERPAPAGTSTTGRDRDVSQPWTETDEPARVSPPPSDGRRAKIARPAVAQEPFELPPWRQTEEPVHTTTPTVADREAETPPSPTARAWSRSAPGRHKVRELEAEFGPVVVPRAQSETSPRLEAAQSLTTRKDLEFFKPRIEALITNVESRRQEAAQEIWTRTVMIVVPSVTLDNQQQALREGLVQWVNNEIRPGLQTGEALRRQPWIVGWFFDMLREVVIALAKEALIELLMPGVHLIIPPTGFVDAVLTACTMLEIAETV